MNKIRQQANLDSSLKTIIEIAPKKFDFGKRKFSEKLTGVFYIKNLGKTIFNPVSVKPDCDCIVISCLPKAVPPNDSLKVEFELNAKNEVGYISHSIVTIGNCQFGNQTFFINGIILNK